MDVNIAKLKMLNQDINFKAKLLAEYGINHLRISESKHLLGINFFQTKLLMY
jgi:hypothetical protein